MYLYIKALHVFAVVALISGMLLMAFTLRSAARYGNADSIKRSAELVIRWDVFITTPALATVWLAGITMAFGAGFGTPPWLVAKLVPALFLSGLHSAENLALRRFLQDGKEVHPLFAVAPATILASLAIIAWLAITKPF
jgi:uncharacterized membrane protein